MEKAPSKLELITGFFPDLSNGQLAQFAALDTLYTAWNDKINVISRKDIDSLYEKHILHSLSIAAAFRLKQGFTVLDIGTGGGFPGIPLAIFFPDVKFHLIDSIGKKIRVVKEIASAIALSNLSAEKTRAEEIKSMKFDLVVSRAVAPLKELWKWSMPLLKSTQPMRQDRNLDPPVRQMPGTFIPQAVAEGLICLKGGDLEQEISESRCTPKIIEIDKIFPLEFFQNKYILQIPPY